MNEWLRLTVAYLTEREMVWPVLVLFAPVAVLWLLKASKTVRALIRKGKGEVGGRAGADQGLTPPTKELGKWVEEILGRIAVWFYGNSFFALAVMLALTLIAAVPASRLKIDTELSRLLPASFESVRDLNEVKEKNGGEGYLVVVARDAEPVELRRFAEDLTPRLAALPEVRYVENRRSTEFFQRHALYFLSTEDLDTIRDRIEARKEWEVLHAAPFFVDLLDTPPPSVDFSDIEQKYRSGWMQTLAFGKARSPFYLDEENRMIAVFVKPAGLASDLKFAQRVVRDVTGLIAGFDLSSYGPDMRVELTGRYKKRVDMNNQIQRDLTVASTAALLLMVVYVVFHFRRWAAVGLVFLPLIVGLVWTFGFAALMFRELNILTAFIGSILLGLGIDHGIHLLSRYQLECTLDRCDTQSILKTFESTGRVIVLAALTTMVAFVGLVGSEFKLFFQFGVIAIVGMTLVMISYLTCLPALLGGIRKTGWSPKLIERPERSFYGSLIARRSGLFLGLILSLAAFTMTGIPKASFNYDFAALDDGDLPSYRLDEKVNTLLGYSQTPLVIWAPDEEAERTYAAAVRRRMEEWGPRSLVGFVLSLSDLVPSFQEQKQKILLQIKHSMRLLDMQKMEPAQRERLENFREMTEAEPFSRAQLPESVRRRFSGAASNGEGSFVLIYSSVPWTQGDRVVKLAEELRNIPLPDGKTVRAAGEGMILADMLRMVFDQAAPILTITVVLVFLSMWLFLGRFGLALLCLLPGVFTLLMTVGVLPRAGLRFNYLNVVVIPVLFGIAVDGGLHLVMHMERRHGIEKAVAQSGPPIVGALLTTALGFGALLMAHHPGLQSFGELALWGLGMNLLCCLVGFAAILSFLYPLPRSVPIFGNSGLVQHFLRSLLTNAKCLMIRTSHGQIAFWHPCRPDGRKVAVCGAPATGRDNKHS